MVTSAVMTMVMLIKFFESTMRALHSLLVYLFVKCLLVILLKISLHLFAKPAARPRSKCQKKISRPRRRGGRTGSRWARRRQTEGLDKANIYRDRQNNMTHIDQWSSMGVSRPTRWSLWYWYLDVSVDHLYFQFQVTEKYSTAMCYWYGGLHGGGQHGREGGWNVQNQVYQAWNVLKRSY